MSIVVVILLIIFSCLIIWKASDGFESASEYLGRNLSDGVKGATINAIGSSIPELFTTLFFLLILNNQEGFSGGVGTTAGSAIFNAIIIPALVIITVISVGKVQFIKVSKKVILRDGIVLLFCELALIYILSKGVLYWWHGLTLMLLYASYVTFMLLTMKKSNTIKDDITNCEEKELETDASPKGMLHNILFLNLEKLIIGKKDISSKSAWLLLLTATLIIGLATALLVKSCEQLGHQLNIPVYFVAVIIASAATSVPDTFLSIKDAKKGNYDDAVSNALGSNIFDICFALGLPLFLYTIFVTPIQMGGIVLANVNELMVLLFIITLITFIIYVLKPKLDLISGYLLIGIYLLFITFIIAKSLEAEWSNHITNILRILH